MDKNKTLDDPSSLGVRHRLRFLAKDSLVYGGAGALNKAFGLIAFPLLARHFSVEEYGIIDFLSVLSYLLTTLVVFGQDSTVARFFYDNKDQSYRQQVISQSLFFLLAVLFILIPSLLILVSQIGDSLVDISKSRTLLQLVVLQTPFLVLITFSQNILKWTFARSKYLFISMGSTIFTVVTLIVVLLFFKLDVVAVFIIYLAVRASFGLLGLLFIQQWIAKPEDWSLFRQMLHYALPLGIISSVTRFIPAIERSFITAFLGERELGLFSAGAKVALLIALPIQAFQVAWGPFSLAIFKESDAPATYNWVLKGFAVGIFTSVIILTAIGEQVVQILASKNYAGTFVVVFPIAMGLAIQGTGWITEIGISLSKRSHLRLYSHGVFLFVSIAMIYMLLPLFGLAGVAWGSMLGYLAKTLTESWLAQRAYPLSWNYLGVLTLGGITLFAGLLSQIIAVSVSSFHGTAVAVLCAFVVVVYGWTCVFSRSERVQMVAVFNQIIKRS